MPGLITHKKILEDTINLMTSSKRKKSFIDKSILTLMSSPEYRRAALFGSIGPNIFDYLPKRDLSNYAGHPVSCFIHDGNADKLIESFLSIIKNYSDKRTHWASMQRAYLYGFISHMIADTLIHPFAFYWSGFPRANTKKELIYYRHQNLLFYYNMDNYFLHRDDNKDSLFFNIDEMVPIEKKTFIKRISPAIRSFILKAMEDAYEEIFQSLIIKKPGTKTVEDNYYTSMLTSLDLIPPLFFLTQKLKRTSHEKLKTVLDKLVANPLTYTDHFVRYPHQRNINNHVLNLHMEKWQHPAGSPELKYESIKKLIKAACDKTLEIWIQIEQALISEPGNDISIDFSKNAFTGTTASYHEMELSQPVKLNNF